MKKGWQTKKLGEIYKIGSSKRVLQSQWKTEGVPFYRGREVTRLAADGFVDNELFISEEHFAELSNEYGVPKAGDIVITAIGTIGNSHVVRSADRFYFKDASVLWMKRTAEVSSEFVNLWLKSPAFFDQLDRGNGATVDTLTIQKLQSVEIAVPPLAEQQRIVGLLDEAFEGLATAKANAEKNLQNARALFESHLQSVFTQRGPGWVEKKLGDVFEIGSSKRIMETEWTSAGVPFYGGKEIVKLAKFGSVVSNAHISEEKYQDYASKYDMPRKDDILITARGTIGVGYVVQEGDKFYYKDGNIISMRGKTPSNPHFVLYAFRSNVMTDQFGDLAGTTVRHLPIEKAKELVLRMPGFDAQNSVVKDIREIEAETQRLARLYERKLAALEALKKSLLHQAFSGEL